MKKRILSSLLCGALLLSLAACGTGSTGDVEDTTDTTAAVEEILPAGIEKQSYNKNINIAILEWGLYENYFVAGKDMTDVMNKALYNRELEVEEYLGVDITYEFVGNYQALHPTLKTAASTNDDLYQIALNHCIDGNAKLITDGLVLDMNELDIDFTGEWFNQDANDALSVMGRQFFCVSDYMLPDPNAILFNKNLVNKNGLEDPYQLVRDGEWTIDKMVEMAHAVTADNGDTVWDEKDTYGFVSPGNWFTISFIYGADIDLITKNSDDEFELAFGDDRSYTMMEKLNTLINSNDAYITSANARHRVKNEEIRFTNGNGLFTLYALNQLSTIRDIDMEFGILPYPKLDENQDEYISNDWTGLMCVPITLDESSYVAVGDVIELLAYHSEEEVIPAYIDSTLGLKLARDTESREMLEIIFDGCTFNPGLNYFGHTTGTFEIVYSIDKMLVQGGQNNFASFLASYSPVAERVINNFNDDVKSLNN